MGACPDASDARDDLLQLAFVVGELAAELLDHGVDVVELGRVAGGDGEAGHGPLELAVVEAVHGSNWQRERAVPLPPVDVWN